MQQEGTSSSHLIPHRTQSNRPHQTASHGNIHHSTTHHSCHPNPHPPTCQEEDEEDCECPVDEQGLLLPGHAVGAQAILLVLSKASNNLLLSSCLEGFGYGQLTTQ